MCGHNASRSFHFPESIDDSALRDGVRPEFIIDGGFTVGQVLTV